MSSTIIDDNAIPTPPYGWIVELKEAKEAAKKAGESDILAQFRVARAYHILRQWQNLRDICNNALSAQEKKLEKHQLILLKQYQKDAENVLLIRSRADSYSQKIQLKKLIKEDCNLDKVICPHEIFKNSNLLQNAALEGDIRFMEQIVAAGAAIDYPFLKSSQCGQPIVAPTDSTALVMICAVLALYGKLDSKIFKDFMSNELRRVLQGQLDCAVQLVWLGADVNTKLRLPSSSDSSQIESFRRHGFDGKSAKQLAIISKQNALIQAMNQLETEEAKIAKIHCRCGSRLPWKQCHSGGKYEVPPYDREDNRKLNWRYSPTAKCPCGNNQKIHYKCCWLETTKPDYLDDSDGTLTGVITLRPSDAGRRIMINHLARLTAEAASTGRLDEPIFPQGMEGKEMTAKMGATLIRQNWSLMCQMSAHDSPRSQIPNWDVDVFVGCVERLGDRWFYWNDLHWQLEKSVLLVRTQEWNDALEKYVNDKGITGEDRDAIVKKHKANPLAPCANLSCQVWERKVKEFQRCGRCKRVAYCSRKCQTDHWKRHKPECIDTTTSRPHTPKDLTLDNY
mmetsp:Transcript_23173/g.33234  ORF Transcript_23173/g.33234 Transcript_23173/m.33234 type:complete len:565 (-) Transcript_23173:257-1951(-)